MNIYKSMKQKQINDLYVQLNKLQNARPVSHILHLLLSIVTGGFWLIVWVLVAASTPSIEANAREQIKLKKKIEKLEKEMEK